MDPFVQRLVERLFDPAKPLSRNRHFHTFDNVEGRRALRIHRRLAALRRDIIACRARGGRIEIIASRASDPDASTAVEVRVDALNGRRVSTLERAELALLASLPGVREALGGSDLVAGP